MNQLIGKYFIIIGIFMLIAGVILYYKGGFPGWFGRLPGDIRIQKDNFRFYFPLTSMILVSVMITVIINLIRRFFN